jgi:HEAT repeat protein
MGANEFSLRTAKSETASCTNCTVPLFKSKFAKLVAELSSRVETKAKRAASSLDALLYPNYSPGPRMVTAAENQQILNAHYAAIRCSEVLDPLLEATHRGTDFARTYAATVLGHIGDHRAVPSLIDALSDPSPPVRRATAKSLGFLQAVSAVPMLVRALDDSDPELSRTAASALGHIRSREAVLPLMALYERGDRESKVAALLALGYIRDPRSLPLARAALLDRVRKVRDAAKSALAQYDYKRRHEG